MIQAWKEIITVHSNDRNVNGRQFIFYLSFNESRLVFLFPIDVRTSVRISVINVARINI